MRFLGILALAFMLLSVSGCFEAEEEYVINPDGSGKVNLSVTLTPSNMMSNSEPDPEKEKVKTLQSMLEESKGVETWKDVSVAVTGDGKVRLKGTAYFKDYSKLKIKYGDMSSNRKLTLDKKEDGSFVLEFDRKESGSEEPAPEMSKDELEKKIQAQKMQYQKMKPMMETFMKSMKQTYTFSLPGTLGEHTNFKKTEDGRLQLTIDGEKFMEVFGELMDNDEWWKKQILSGQDLKDMKLGDEINEKLFGEKGPVRAVFSGEMKPLFDFKAEVETAKKEYPEMLKKLGIEEKIAVEPADGSGLKSLKVGGVRLVKVFDMENDVRPFHMEVGYTLALIGEFDGSVLKVDAGQVEKAEADNGQNLLPENDWKRKISFPRLSKDKTCVLFEVKLNVPSEDVKYIKEISGHLEYTVASGTKELDLGIAKFEEGAQGKELSAQVKSVKDHPFQKGSQQLSLSLACDLDNIKEFRFLDKDGSQLEVAKRGHYSSGSNSQVNFSIKGSFPEEGKIVVVLYDNVKKYRIPFELTDITLTGEPRK